MEMIEKRQQSQNDEPPKKQQRFESLDVSNGMLNIMDVNDDCLEHILRKCDVNDLLNVADLCKRMRKAARLTFKAMYGKKMLYMFYEQNQSFEITENQIKICKFSKCLKAMRCFGDSISKINIGYAGYCKSQCDEMDRYFYKYCAASVTELKCHGRYKTNRFKKNVEIFKNRFQCNPTLLRNWMDFNIEWITAHIPRLEHLSINVGNNQLKNLTTCLQMNQQIRSLDIAVARVVRVKIDLQFIRVISECPQLENLNIRGFSTGFTISGTDAIHFKSVKKFGTWEGCLRQLVASSVLILFDQLEEFIFSGPLDENVNYFISKHPSLKKFTSVCKHEVMDRNIMLKYAEALQSMTEVHFMFCTFSVDDAIGFIDECKLLKKFTFSLAECDEYDVLQRRLGKEWRPSINSSNVELAR